MMRLKERYKKEIVPQLKKELSRDNNLLIPRLSKVVINVGFGKHGNEKEFMASVAKTLTAISGQKPVFTKSKKSISAFKLREGMTIGAMVTLRGDRMYDFIDKLINVTFPRVRDFRGLDDKAIDKTGNFSIGFKENSAFPEMKAEDIENVHGLEVVISSTAKNREDGLALYNAIGFPFKK
jgi:large subunit ribosomal protein L5